MREIERRIQRTEAKNASDVTAVEAPLGVPATFEEHTALMFDLLAVAYQADLTRIFTFMMGREASQRTYPGLGIAMPHHDVSHHGGQAEKMEQHAKINAHYAKLFAAFVDRLGNSPDGDGSVLDHSLIAFGARHERRPGALRLPAAARHRRRRWAGRSKATASWWRPTGRRWRTSGLRVAALFGSPLERFGESTGRVEL